MSLSIEQIFAAMQEVVASNSALKKKFNASVEFQMNTGQKLRLDITNDTPKQHPDLTITTSLDTFQKLLASKLTPQQAFMQKKLKVKGSMAIAMKLNMLLRAMRKSLKKPKSKL